MRLKEQFSSSMFGHPSMPARLSSSFELQSMTRSLGQADTPP